MSDELLNQLDADIPDEPEGEQEEVEVTPEPTEDEGDEPDSKPDSEPGKPEKPDPEPKTVPLAAHIEERNKLKARISELEAQQKGSGLSEEDRQLLAELRELKSRQQEEPAPDFANDPKGYVDWLNKQHAKALEKLEKQNQERDAATKQTQEQMQHQARVQGVLSAVAQQEAAFAQKQPDYEHALTHAREVRANQLKMLFPEATEEQVNQQIAIEEIAAAERLLQQGQNPAEFAYNYAKTLGYQTKTNGAAPTKPDRGAVTTLGSGGGGGDPDDDDDDGDDIVAGLRAAQKEAFGR